MTTRALLALIVRSLRDAEVEEQYSVLDEQSGGDNGRAAVSVANFKDAKPFVSFRENPEELLGHITEITLEDNGDNLYAVEDFDLDAAKRALQNVETSYRVRTDDGNYVYISEKEYKSLKPQKLLTFDYDLNGENYDVKLDLASGTLSIGCQSHSLREWEREGKSIIEQNVGGYVDEEDSSAHAAYEALRAALPAIRARVERAQPRSRARTAAGRRSRAKTATGRRSRRRSSGRSRSR